MQNPDEINQKLELIYERLDELEDVTLSIRHAQKMAVFWKVFYYLFLIGIGIGLFVWAKPFVEKAQQGLIQVQENIKKVQTGFQKVEDKTAQVQDFFNSKAQ